MALVLVVLIAGLSGFVLGRYFCCPRPPDDDFVDTLEFDDCVDTLELDEAASQTCGPCRGLFEYWTSPASRQLHPDRTCYTIARKAVNKLYSTEVLAATISCDWCTKPPFPTRAHMM